MNLCAVMDARRARSAVSFAAGAGLLIACSSGASSTTTASDAGSEGGLLNPSGDATAWTGTASGGGSFGADSDAADAGPVCAGDGGPGSFTCTGSMSVARDVPGGATLIDGRVLVAGGWNAKDGVLTSAELYDPASGAFHATGGMSTGHLWAGWGAPWPLLPSGKVLVAGGLDASGGLPASAEVYDPAVGAFGPTGALPAGIISMSPLVLDDGTVLFAGGWDSVTSQTMSQLPGWSYVGSGTSTVLRYEPLTGTFARTGALAENRLFGCNVRLTTGDALVIAGAQGASTVEDNVELYSPEAGTWTSTGTFTGAAFCARAFVMPNANVLLTGTGGLTGSTLAVPGTLLFDSVALTTRPTANATAGWSPNFVQLASGDVLAFGGTLSGTVTARAAVYKPPPINAWMDVGNLSQPRGGAVGAAVLPSGEVLIAGGKDAYGAALASAEIYHP